MYLIFFSLDPVNIIGFRPRKIAISSPRLRAKLVRVVRRRCRKIAQCHFDRRKEKKEREKERERDREGEGKAYVLSRISDIL